jgi:hypothetical protein
MSKKASKRVCTSIIVYSDPLSPSPSTFSAVNTPYNTELDPDDPETVAEGDMQTEYPCD